MKKEITVTAKTVEEAVTLGAGMLEMQRGDVTYEVIEQPKRGFLGIGEKEAKVRVIGEMSPSDVAVGFIKNIIKHLDIDAKIEVVNADKNELKYNISGQDLGILIGYHGEMLDSIQYLTYLAVNREFGHGNDDSSQDNGIRISIDVENYRKKREETLVALAVKMADRVKQFDRPVTLEPMNSYERRIIHSTIQEIPGITTYSVGNESERRIVVTKESFRSQRNSGYKSDSVNKKSPYRPYNKNYNKPSGFAKPESKEKSL